MDTRKRHGRLKSAKRVFTPEFPAIHVFSIR